MSKHCGEIVFGDPWIWVLSKYTQRSCFKETWYRLLTAEGNYPDHSPLQPEGSEGLAILTD